MRKCRCGYQVPDGLLMCPSCGREGRDAGREFTQGERIVGANAQRTARMERALQAWALHREGVPVREIAAALGVGVSTAYRYIGQRPAIMGEIYGVRAHLEEVRAGAGSRPILTCWNSRFPAENKVRYRRPTLRRAGVCACARARLRRSRPPSDP